MNVLSNNNVFSNNTIQPWMTQCIFVSSLTFLDNLSFLISPIYTTSYTLWYNTESEIKYDKFQKILFYSTPKLVICIHVNMQSLSIVRCMQFCK